MKIAIVPKNVECCDGLRPRPGHPSGLVTTKGPGTFVVVLLWQAASVPWYTMNATSRYTPHRRTIQKDSHGRHL